MEGFEVGNEGMMVSHLQFADDTLMMYKNLVRQLRYQRCVIQCFEVVSGLRVNLWDLLMIYGGFSKVLGCQKGSLPSYLELPLGFPFKCKTIWNLVLQRINGGLASWKGMLMRTSCHVEALGFTSVGVPPLYGSSRTDCGTHMCCDLELLFQWMCGPHYWDRIFIFLFHLSSTFLESQTGLGSFCNLEQLVATLVFKQEFLDAIILIWNSNVIRFRIYKSIGNYIFFFHNCIRIGSWFNRGL